MRTGLASEKNEASQPYLVDVESAGDVHLSYKPSNGWEMPFCSTTWANVFRHRMAWRVIRAPHELGQPIIETG